jgi:death-on-curing protein
VRYLTLGEVLELHRRVLEAAGGGAGLRSLAALESAVAQPRMTFENQDLYRDVAAKGAALAFSLIQNHPFIDGNKRVGHAAMATFLLLNGHVLTATVEAGEATIIGVASGVIGREALEHWIRAHMDATAL